MVSDYAFGEHGAWTDTRDSLAALAQRDVQEPALCARGCWTARCAVPGGCASPYCVKWYEQPVVMMAAVGINMLELPGVLVPFRGGGVDNIYLR